MSVDNIYVHNNSKYVCVCIVNYCKHEDYLVLDSYFYLTESVKCLSALDSVQKGTEENEQLFKT